MAGHLRRRIAEKERPQLLWDPIGTYSYKIELLELQDDSNDLNRNISTVHSKSVLTEQPVVASIGEKREVKQNGN